MCGGGAIKTGLSLLMNFHFLQDKETSYNRRNQFGAYIQELASGLEGSGGEVCNVLKERILRVPERNYGQERRLGSGKRGNAHLKRERFRQSDQLLSLCLDSIMLTREVTARKKCPA